MQNIDMMYIMIEPQPDNATEKQTMKYRYKFFLDVAQQQPVKQLPYADDLYKVELSKLTNISNNPTLIKFVSVMVGIIHMNDRQLALRALSIWLEFLQQDEIMKRQLNPNPEFLRSMNLA